MNIDILRTLSYGMYAIGVNGREGPSACIANTVFQITVSPAIVAVSIHHDNYTNECIKENGLFTVSVLSENTAGAVIGALGFYSGRNTNKLANVNYKMLQEGVPVVKEHSCCWFLCNVKNYVETSTHTVFFAEIVAGSEKYRGIPMTYSYYQTVMKGKSSKNAPTYRQESSTPELSDKYVCTICGYVYSGEEENFEDLPPDWLCPICGAPKSVFKIK